MCGIFGYTGKKKAAPLLVEGLYTLEYRGYDSSGMYVAEMGSQKAAGEVANLAKRIDKHVSGTAGIAHTRWATHGKPSEANAHPHTGMREEIFVVHNGIVENYQTLKAQLKESGCVFVSETDTEVLAHLIENAVARGHSLEQGVIEALKHVSGSYGIAVMSAREPGKIVAARRGSPIVIGIGDGEYFIASDATAIIKHTRTAIYLKDGECAVVTPTHHSVFSMELQRRFAEPQQITWSVEDVQKSGFDHFMVKEIMEAPTVLKNTARGRLLPDQGDVKLGGLEPIVGRLEKVERLVLIGCGSAYYAGLIGKLYFEEIAGIPTEVEIASEYRYRTLPYDDATAVLAISQSGETADTLACLKEAQKHGVLTLGIVNVVGSSIAREVDAGVYNYAGPEISVASTKAYLSQLEALLLVAIFLGRRRRLSLERGKEIVRALQRLPEQARAACDTANHVRTIAKRYAHFENMLYIGRKYNYPVALEGALKLKEVSYIHAEGYGAGEMKHGPIAMIDDSFPTLAVMPKDSVYEKTRSNVEEIRARNGKVIALTTTGENIAHAADDVIEIPYALEILTPFLATIPLQLFAYYASVARGHNVDRPRNLAKSVTVE